MSYDTLRNLFALIGVASCLWWGGLWLSRFLGWVQASEIERQRAETAPVPAPAAVPRAAPGIPPEHIAAIAAAVAAMGGHMRAVRLTDTTTGQIWASEGRWLHQTSHQTH